MAPVTITPTLSAHPTTAVAIDRSPSQPATKTIPWTALSLLLYILAAMLLFSKAWLAPNLNEIGGGIDVDAKLATWFLEWTPYALMHGINPLLSTYVDYPAGISLMWNTSMVVPAVVLAPITLTAGPVVAYNVLTTLAVALSAWCAYLAIRALTGSHLAGGLGGLLYGFSPFVMTHALGQPSVLMLMFPPLVLLLLNEILVRQRRSSTWLGIWLGVAAAAEVLTNEEVLATTAMFSAVGLVVLVALHWRQVRARLAFSLRSLTTALIVFVPLAAYPLWFQFFGPQRVRSLLPDRYQTDVLAFIVPTPIQLFSTHGLLAISQHFTNLNLVEQAGAYLGVPLILLVLVTAIVFQSRTLIRIAVAVGAVVAVLALGSVVQIDGRVTHRLLPGHWLERLPLFRSIVPPRLVPYLDLMVAVILGVWVAGSMAARRRNFRMLGVLAAIVALLPLLPALPYPGPPAYTPAFFTSADVRRIPQGEVVLVAPFSRQFNSDAMLWQAQSGMRFRMPEGYAWRPGPSRDPVPSALQTVMGAIQDGTPVPALTSELRDQLLADLHRFNVRTVIVGPVNGRAKMVSLFSAVFGRDPEQIDGVDVWWSV